MTTTITAINPWSKAVVELKAEDMINPADAYPFDQEISDKITGDYASDWEWAVEYAKHTTPEQMGIILLGS